MIRHSIIQAPWQEEVVSQEFIRAATTYQYIAQRLYPELHHLAAVETLRTEGGETFARLHSLLQEEAESCKAALTAYRSRPKDAA